MAKAMPEKRIHLYDTFTGIMGAIKGVDVHGNGDFSDVSLEDIRKAMNSFDSVFHVGLFPETFKEQDRKFSFVHSDTDTYFGTVETLKIFPILMSAGGKIVFDDYLWHGCPGVEKALTEFLKENSNYKTQKFSNQFIINF